MNNSEPEKMYERNPVTGQEVYSSKEFQDFCTKFGIVWEAQTTDLVIILPALGVMRVLQEYHGSTSKRTLLEGISLPFIVEQPKEGGE